MQKENYHISCPKVQDHCMGAAAITGSSVETGWGDPQTSAWFLSAAASTRSKHLL